MSLPNQAGEKATLQCLGVGDGWAGTNRRHSSYLYQFGQRTVLVDCGDGVSAGFKIGGQGYAELDRVLLSHLHSDHVGSFSLLVQGLWLQQRRRPLPVHLPGPAIATMRTWLEATILPPELIGFPIEWRPLKPSEKFRAGAVRITAFPTTHLESLRRALQPSYPAACFEAFSFLFAAPGLRIAHTADIGDVADLAPLLTKPLDLLVCELAHFEPAALFAALRGKAVKRIVFIHLAREYWNDLPGTRKLLKAGLGGIPFVIAKDGDHFTV